MLTKRAKKANKMWFVEYFIMLLFFIGILIWFAFGFEKIVDTTRQEKIDKLTETIKKSVVLCYSIEGAFPPNIDYLKENYNLIINDKEYLIHYNAFASNIMPEIIVFPRY